MPFQSSFFRARKCHTECCRKQAERNVTWRQVEERQPSSGWTATDSAPTSVGLRVSAPRTRRNGQLSIICPGRLGIDWEFGHSFRRGLPYKGLSWYMYVATRDFLGGLPYRTFLECCHLGLSGIRLALGRWGEMRCLNERDEGEEAGRETPPVIWVNRHRQCSHNSGAEGVGSKNQPWQEAFDFLPTVSKRWGMMHYHWLTHQW